MRYRYQQSLLAAMMLAPPVGAPPPPPIPCAPEPARDHTAHLARAERRRRMKAEKRLAATRHPRPAALTTEVPHGE